MRANSCEKQQKADHAVLRAASSTDSASILALLRQAGLPTEGVDSSLLEGMCLATSGRQLVGCAAIERHSRLGLLRSVAVEERWRGKGLGAWLVRDRLSWSASHGLEWTYLLTDTAPEFFARFGFHRVDRDVVPTEIRSSREYAAICPQSAVVMARRVEPWEWGSGIHRRYSRAARRVEASCPPGGSAWKSAAELGYSHEELEGLPHDAVAAALGCGNPTVLAGLKPGQTVLDLGSGGGLDAILSARRVGPEGCVYGLEANDDMLALAEKNRHEADVSNLKFLKGRIESIPLPDACVDVVLSNCVLNLSMSKEQALRESFRVLRPGGTFAITDIVATGSGSREARRELELEIGCLAGTLEVEELRALLAGIGFESVEIVPVGAPGAAALPSKAAANPSRLQPVENSLLSALVRARKPSNEGEVQ